MKKKKKGEAGENLDPHCQKKREKKSDEWIKQIPKLRMGGGGIKIDSKTNINKHTNQTFQY